MGNFALKLWVWTKITVFVLLIIFALVFIYENKDREVVVWLWGDRHWTVLPVLFFSCLFSVVGTLLVRTTFRTIRQIQDLKARTHAEQMAKDLADMKAKAARLQTKPSEDVAEET